MENIASILSHLMSKNNISSAELARRTGIGQPVIYRLMTGITENPQVLTLKPIAEYFGITVDSFVGLAAKTSRRLPEHEVQNKLAAIKTISSVLCDTMPLLTQGYQKAVAAKLIVEDISMDILPLLLLNCSNLLKTINQLNEILLTNQD